MTYKSFSIWDRSDEGLYRYRMVENLTTGKYTALMRDYFGSQPSIPKDHLIDLDKYFIELLIEMAPEGRGGGLDTIQAAIAAFDESFRSDAKLSAITEDP